MKVRAFLPEGVQANPLRDQQAKKDFIITGVETLQPPGRGGRFTIVDGLKLGTYPLECGQLRAAVVYLEDGVNGLHVAEKQAFKLVQLDIGNEARVGSLPSSGLHGLPPRTFFSHSSPRAYSSSQADKRCGSSGSMTVARSRRSTINKSSGSN